MGRSNEFNEGNKTFEVGTSGMASPSKLMPLFDPNMRGPEELEKSEGAYQQNLQHHMKEHGFQGEIEIRKYGDGTTMINDGHHRLVAAKNLGISAVPYRVLDLNDRGGKNEVCPKCAAAGHTWLTTSGKI